MGLLAHHFSKIGLKTAQNSITWSKFNLFWILNHHRVAFMPKIMAVPTNITSKCQGEKFSCSPFSKKSQPHLAPYDHI